METAVLSALSAVLGSLVGGSATIATAWFTQRSLSRREAAQMELERRERMYSKFVVECSKLAMDAYTHTLERPETVLPILSTVNQMRLTSSPEVLAIAHATVERITEQYFAPNLSIQELHELARSGEGDPLRAFSEACREELTALRRRARMV